MAMQFKFGSFPAVVASSADMAKLFLKTYDHIFASRFQFAAGKYTTYNYRSYRINEDLDMNEVYGLATIRKFPLVAVMEPRLLVHLYDPF